MSRLQQHHLGIGHRIADGELRELTEYLDTELVATALAPPGAASD
jgi:hypothetical protein